MHACGVCDIPAIFILLSSGARGDAVNIAGESPLGYLCAYVDDDEENRIMVCRHLVALIRCQSGGRVAKRLLLEAIDIARNAGGKRIANLLKGLLRR